MTSTNIYAFVEVNSEQKRERERERDIQGKEQVPVVGDRAYRDESSNTNARRWYKRQLPVCTYTFEAIIRYINVFMSMNTSM
jgi:hypothetical protein